MRLRTEPKQPQIRLRTPRVPSVPSTNDSFLKALTKEIFLFDQSFFISEKPNKSVFLLDQSFYITKENYKRVFLFDQSVLVSKAAEKRVFLFDQSFSIRVFPLKQFLLKFVFSQYYICFPTSVF